MSLLLAGTVGVSRDLAAPKEPISIAPADSGAGATAGFGQLVVAQIPGEALLAYTTLLALFSASSTGYQTGRWILYGLSLPACAAVVLSAYVAGHGALVTGSPASLHLPWLPMATAVIAMAIYGLSVPGSPLQQSMSDTGFAITAGCLSVGGGIVMSIFAPFLGRGNSVVLTATTPARTPVAVAA
jgi:hypothetical protein